jgi:hypothetical protein
MSRSEAGDSNLSLVRWIKVCLSLAKYINNVTDAIIGKGGRQGQRRQLLEILRTDSSVGIALGYGLDDRDSRIRFPAGAGNYSLHHRV